MVIIDGVHALSRGTTGIGSYTNTLAATLHTLGCDVGVLCGASVNSHTSDPELALGVQVFGITQHVGEPRKLSILKRLLRQHKKNVERSFGVVPVEFSPRGIALAALEAQFPEFDRIWNADNVFERANSMFSKKGKFLKIQTPPSATVAHWTFPIPVTATGVPNLCTIHDLIPLQFPYFVSPDGGRMARLLSKIADQTDHIITVSEASKRNIVDLLQVPEERVSVTYQTTQPTQRLPDNDAERIVTEIYGVSPGKYALFLGAIEPKKNLKRLVEAFLLANTGMSLLIGGPLGWLHDEEVALMDRIKNSATSDRSMSARSTIERLGYLPRRHLIALLQCAKMFLFPSIYEGFGLPVLEAMQLGTPVLTSNTSSLPEVVGDAGLCVDPLDVTGMAAEISRLNNNADLRKELAVRGLLQAENFSLERYQQRLSDAYHRAGVAVFSGPPQPTRPLIASAKYLGTRPISVTHPTPADVPVSMR